MYPADKFRGTPRMIKAAFARGDIDGHTAIETVLPKDKKMIDPIWGGELEFGYNNTLINKDTGWCYHLRSAIGDWLMDQLGLEIDVWKE